jgi:hypothetical protein
MKDHPQEIDVWPSAPVMEDVSLDDDPEIALAPAVPVAAPVCCAAHAAVAPNPPYPVHPQYAASYPAEPVPMPVASAVAPPLAAAAAPEPVPAPRCYTVSNEDYTEKMRQYRNRRTGAWVASGVVLVVVLVVGIVMVNKQREAYNQTWSDHGGP